MDQENRPFGLNVPEQVSGKNTLSFDIRSGAVNKWLRQLPLGSADDAVRLVYSALFETNRVTIEPKKRFKLLEQLRSRLNFMLNSMQKQYLGQSLPLRSKARSQLSRTNSLLSEFCNGYKQAIVDLLNEKKAGNRKLLAQSTHRALICLNRILENTYQVYSPVASHLWEEIHRLCYLGEKMNYLDINCKDPEGDTPLNSVSLVYRHTLLLSIINPSRLRQADISQASKLLSGYSKLISLSRQQPENYSYPFSLRLDNGEAPGQINTSSEGNPRYIRYLTLDRLVDALNEKLGSQSLDNKEEEIARRILALWQQERQRQHTRHYTDGVIQLGIGLFMSHQLLNKLKQANRPAQVKHQETKEDTYLFSTHEGINPVMSSHTEFSIEPVQLNQSFDNGWQKTKPEEQYPDKSRTAKTTAFAPPSTSQQTHAWKTLDCSEGGCCLLWDQDTPSQVQVGEIVAMHSSEYANKWVIGIVRWIHYLQGHGIKIGVQIISREASAVSTRSDSASQGLNRDFECLSLDNTPGNMRNSSLLVPAHRYQVGDQLTIRNEDQHNKVMLTRLMEDTGNYSRFQYQAVA